MKLAQPQDNKYNPDVFDGLVTLASKFREQQCFSVADELEAMALRGPDRWKGLEHLSDQEVLMLVSDRLQRIANQGQVS